MQDRLETPGDTAARRSRVLPLLLRGLLPLGVLALGWIGYSILSVEPEKPPRPKAKARLIKTRVQELRVEDFATTIRTRGVVRPHNEVLLTPEVAGKIVRILPEFEDGAFFAAGDALVELDPQDLQAAVMIAKAQLARADAAHAQEETKSKQARLNWNDLGYKDEPNDLVLRLPQLREAKANVDSATAQLEQAQRNLERAQVRAPFDGRVRQRTVGLGQSVGTGTALGTVFSIDFAEVRLPIAARNLAFLTLPEGSEDPAVQVTLRDALGEDDETVWTAEIIRTEGTLDESSLDLFAIARVIDPFGRKTNRPPLRIGQPIVAEIPGRVLTDVVAVPRRAVSQLDRIFLIDRDELTIRSHTIEPIWTDKDHVVVGDPTIAAGSLLAMTHLIYAPEGSKVEILPDLELEESAETAADSKASSPSGEKQIAEKSSS